MIKQILKNDSIFFAVEKRYAFSLVLYNFTNIIFYAKYLRFVRILYFNRIRILSHHIMFNILLDLWEKNQHNTAIGFTLYYYTYTSSLSITISCIQFYPPFVPFAFFPFDYITWCALSHILLPIETIECISPFEPNQ